MASNFNRRQDNSSNFNRPQGNFNNFNRPQGNFNNFNRPQGNFNNFNRPQGNFNDFNKKQDNFVRNQERGADFFIRKHLWQLKPTHDDDSFDRLNHAYTIYILLGLAITIAAKNYVGQPLQCWMPAQFKKQWERFAESYCFVENTYFVPFNATIPELSTRESREIVYYQWVPFIFLGMALLFYVPRTFWKVFSRQSGLTLSDLTLAAHRAPKQNPKSRHNLIKNLSYNLQQLGKRYGSYLSRLFMITKVLYVVNVAAQFLFLNSLLRSYYTIWGLGILWDIMNGRHWQESGHFPRVTYCDVEVRVLSAVNTWTLQCVLMIFLFLWFWLLIVLVCSCIGLVKWIIRSTTSSQLSFVEQLLVKEKPSEADLNDFYSQVLQRDGVLVLRLLKDNAGFIMASDVADDLFETFNKRADAKDL